MPKTLKETLEYMAGLCPFPKNGKECRKLCAEKLCGLEQDCKKHGV